MGPQYIDPGFARQSTADRRDAAKRNGGAGFSSERFQLKPLLRCGHSRGLGIWRDAGERVRAWRHP